MRAMLGFTYQWLARMSNSETASPATPRWAILLSCGAATGVADVGIRLFRGKVSIHDMRRIAEVGLKAMQDEFHRTQRETHEGIVLDDE